MTHNSWKWNPWHTRHIQCEPRFIDDQVRTFLRTFLYEHIMKLSSILNWIVLVQSFRPPLRCNSGRKEHTDAPDCRHLASLAYLKTWIQKSFVFLRCWKKISKGDRFYITWPNVQRVDFLGLSSRQQMWVSSKIQTFFVACLKHQVRIILGFSRCLDHEKIKKWKD